MKSAIFLSTMTLVAGLAACSSQNSEYEPALKADLQKHGACAAVTSAKLPIEYKLPKALDSSETVSLLKEKMRVPDALVKVGLLRVVGDFQDGLGLPIRRYDLSKEGGAHYFSEKAGTRSLGGFCYAPEELISIDSVDKAGMEQGGGEVKVKYTAKVGPTQAWVKDPTITQLLKDKLMAEGQKVSGESVLKKVSNGWEVVH